MGGARVTGLARPRSTSFWNYATKTVGWGAGGKEKAVTVSSYRTAPPGPGRKRRQVSTRSIPGVWGGSAGRRKRRSTSTW